MTREEEFAQLEKQMLAHKDALDALYERHHAILEQLHAVQVDFGADLNHERNAAVSMLTSLQSLKRSEIARKAAATRKQRYG